MISKNFILRTISALTLIALIIAVDSFSPKGLLLLGVFIFTLSCLEYAKMCFPQNPKLKYTFVLAAAAILLNGSLGYFDQIFILALAVPLLSLISIWQCRSLASEESFKLVSYIFIGLVYLVILPLSVFEIFKTDKFILFWFLTTIFSGDIAAYLLGSAIGKTKIFPNISPKKTIEGSLGGIFGSVLMGLLFYMLIKDYTHVNMPLIEIILVATLLSLFAQTSDFFESLIKRNFKTKHSGTILPGHGGILDRVDSLYLASPIFFAYLKYIN